MTPPAAQHATQNAARHVTAPTAPHARTRAAHGRALAYGDGVDWNRLPLSRSSVDRHAERRADPELIREAWSREGTQVVLVAGGLLAVVVPGGSEAIGAAPGADRPLGAAARLDLAAPGDLGEEVLELPVSDGTVLVAFLGHDDGDVLALIVPEPALVPGERTWRSLREIGYVLDDRQAGLASAAVALAAWHERHPRCPLCGAATVPTLAGWTRTCVEDGSDHYPRTDPAVIMAVVDDADRILLAHSPHWPERRFSTLAGFVEPGESAEAAVAREVGEEVGVRIGDVTYRGSQSWPFPGSLMLAFRARALSTTIAVDGVEIEGARWFSRDELRDAVAAGEIVLPTHTSIARALIEEWYGREMVSEEWGPRG